MGNRDKRKARDREKRKASRSQPLTPVQIARAKAERRQCGECQACCTTLSIPTLDKPMGQRCPNQCAAGCAIYAQRPPECAGYLCLWRDGWGATEDRPDKLGMIFDLEKSAALAEAGGARSASGKGMVIRAHTVEPTKPLSITCQNHIDYFVRVGEAVVLSQGDTITLIGPKVPEGVRFKREDVIANTTELTGRKVQTLQVEVQ